MTKKWEKHKYFFFFLFGYYSQKFNINQTTPKTIVS
jgi:hypothetical protein